MERPGLKQQSRTKARRANHIAYQGEEEKNPKRLLILFKQGAVMKSQSRLRAAVSLASKTSRSALGFAQRFCLFTGSGRNAETAKHLHFAPARRHLASCE